MSLIIAMLRKLNQDTDLQGDGNAEFCISAMQNSMEREYYHSSILAKDNPVDQVHGITKIGTGLKHIHVGRTQEDPTGILQDQQTRTEGSDKQSFPPGCP